MSQLSTEQIKTYLFSHADEEYKAFQCKLMPGVDEDKVIGVRTPILRTYAKELFKSGAYEEFLAEMPHQYYDMMNLHGFILCEMKDFDRVITEINRFLPFVDNWATCDLVSPKKAFKKNLDSLLEHIKIWMASSETYTIRFGMEMLMSFYLDDEFKPEYLDWVAAVRSDEYYVKMMQAWYFATALAKQYDATLPYIEKQALDDWTHNKAIQKARESFRITPEQKEYLKSLKLPR